jgi:hypothetical protein
MKIKYRYYFGGDSNPYESMELEVYSRLTEEREIADPTNEKPLSDVFPTLDSWADYVLAKSKATFWEMEKEISKRGEKGAEAVYELWKDASSSGRVGDWLKESEHDESEKAMCYYMGALYEQFCPGDITVDFRLYLTEDGVSERGEIISLEPGEDD